MNISFDIEASSLVQKIASQGEMSTLVRAIIAEGYAAEFTSEMSASDLLEDMDSGEIAEWVNDNLSMSDVYDADDIINEIPQRDLVSFVYDNLSLDDIWSDAEALAAIDDDSIRDYVQQHDLLPAGNTASNADLLAEIQRRLTDDSMDADDVLDTLTQSGRLVIRTVYHTK